MEPQVAVTELVAGAMRQGRRIIRHRRLAVTATCAFVALTLGAAGWIVPHHLLSNISPPAEQQAGPALLPATAATVTDLLSSRLPSGVRLSAAYRYENDPPAVAVYLTHDAGTGLVQFVMDSGSAPQTCQPSAGREVECGTEPDGSRTVVTKVSNNCLENTIVERYRKDRVHVSVYVATCLMWDGSRNPPAPAPLTVEEALALSADPVWQVRMDAAVVSAAAARYPSMASWVGEVR